MLLGDVIARFEDEAGAAEALLALDDLALVTCVSAAAADEELTVGEFAARAVGQFVADASDDDWLTLIGRMTRTENPGRVFLIHVLGVALAPANGRRSA